MAGSVVTGYERLVATLQLPDHNDRHVLAAAIAGEATVIVTRNLRDLPDSALEPHGIEAQHPDEFIYRLIQLAPELVVAGLREQQRALNSPPTSMAEVLSILDKIGLTRTVAQLKRILDRAGRWSELRTIAFRPWRNGQISGILDRAGD